MDQFQANFINEANELLEDLEAALLKLEDDLEDLEQVEGVFRVMHTLKGSANMFGFERVGEVTHDLETIYDQIRDSKRDLSKEILDTSLEALDHIKNLIANDYEKYIYIIVSDTWSNVGNCSNGKLYRIECHFC